jgi:hypothetical protein
VPVLAHRLVLKSGDESQKAGRAALERLVAGLSVPV